MKATTTVIIPNYNGRKFLDTCFDSLEKQTYRAFRVIVVDNGSTDGSREWLREHESDRVRVIYLEKNTGFSFAVNAGIRAAGTKYVLLLNNDIRADERFIEYLVKAVSASPRIFSVASRMIQMAHPDRLDSAGDLYTVLGWAYNRGIDCDPDRFSRPAEVFSACAGAAIYRRSVFRKIGLFDEMHFAYLEDIDVGYRARIYGYRNIYCPQAVVYHVGSGSSGSKYNAFKVKLSARNNVYLYYKNMSPLQRVINYPAYLLGTQIKRMFFRKKGFSDAFEEGLAEGRRTVSDCRVVRWRAGHIPNYLEIEAELIRNTFFYVKQQLMKKRSGFSRF